MDSARLSAAKSSPMMETINMVGKSFKNGMLVLGWVGAGRGGLP